MALLQRKKGVLRDAANPSDFEVVADSAWAFVPDEDALPEGLSLISWQRLQREREANPQALLARKDTLGIVIPNDLKDDALESLLSFALIAIQFPKFRDGRGFSIARSLRVRWHYQGELRAVGNVLRDQLLFMHRTGFDSFELSAGKDANDALRAFGEQSAFYQGSVDLPTPLWKRAGR